MSDKKLLFIIFVISSIALIYVEYIADDPDMIVQECETSSMSDDCAEPDRR